MREEVDRGTRSPVPLVLASQLPTATTGGQYMGACDRVCVGGCGVSWYLNCHRAGSGIHHRQSLRPACMPKLRPSLRAAALPPPSARVRRTARTMVGRSRLTRGSKTWRKPESHVTDARFDIRGFHATELTCAGSGGLGCAIGGTSRALAIRVAHWRHESRDDADWRHRHRNRDAADAYPLDGLRDGLRGRTPDDRAAPERARDDRHARCGARAGRAA